MATSHRRTVNLPSRPTRVRPSGLISTLQASSSWPVSRDSTSSVRVSYSQIPLLPPTARRAPSGECRTVTAVPRPSRALDPAGRGSKGDSPATTSYAMARSRQRHAAITRIGKFMDNIGPASSTAHQPHTLRLGQEHPTTMSRVVSSAPTDRAWGGSDALRPNLACNYLMNPSGPTGIQTTLHYVQHSVRCVDPGPIPERTAESSPGLMYHHQPKEPLAVDFIPATTPQANSSLPTLSAPTHRTDLRPALA